MAEFIKLTSMRALNIPIGESLIPHTPLIKELARQVIRMAAERRGRKIIFICDDNSSILLGTAIASTINALEYVPPIETVVISPFMPLSNLELATEYYKESTIILVKDNIVDGHDLLGFKELVDGLLDLEDDAYYTALLTITPFSSMEDSLLGNVPLPTSIINANFELKESVSYCIHSWFGWVIGL